jgi:hypothetical protein
MAKVLPPGKDDFEHGSLLPAGVTGFIHNSAFPLKNGRFDLEWLTGFDAATFRDLACLESSSKFV